MICSSREDVCFGVEGARTVDELEGVDDSLVGDVGPGTEVDSRERSSSYLILRRPE